ncbi:hypothetical protein ILUMI_26186 [Ignelater luminosus]|uniref:Uncharacterized protein n=1 Tax=Ignelater luminosus TaxID=2038154 RepID=A0A8K0C4K2_IGNLU|nr:hypothetical protein ILUMI_26186 [Ignelater luminosus]
MVLNVYKHEIKEAHDEVIGASVFNIPREYKNSDTFSAPKTNKNRSNSISALDDFDGNAIRRKVHQFLFKNEMPSIDKVLDVVIADPDLSNFKRTTFHKLLKAPNFKHGRYGKNSVLLDKDKGEIVLWRRAYLKDIKWYSNENRNLDETLINAGHTKLKIWVDKTMTSSRQVFLSGLSTGLKNPSGKGQRLIICHTGSDDGFVPDALRTFESKKSGNYHEEIVGESFENCQDFETCNSKGQYSSKKFEDLIQLQFSVSRNQEQYI